MEDISSRRERPRVSSEDAGFVAGSGAVVSKRKMTWSAGMGDDVDSGEGENGEMEQVGTGSRRDRRRLQNRLAQRAFRARSKINNQVVRLNLHFRDLSMTESAGSETNDSFRTLDRITRPTA